MPTLYTRATVLRSVGGRIHYITSPKRQEHLLGAYDGAEHLLGGRYWSTLAEESQRSFVRHGELHKDAVEGRELVLWLSDSLQDKQSPNYQSSDRICRTIADSFEKQYHRPVTVALHYNKAENNLHAHIIFAEREVLPEPEIKIAPRNLFFDQDGKRRYKKAEVLDDNGQLRPGCRIVAKGEIYESRSFGPAAPEFAMKKWMKDMKETWALPLLNGPLHGDQEYTLFDYNTGMLPQQHIGNVLTNAVQDQQQEPDNMYTQLLEDKKTYNRRVREYNALVKNGTISRETALRVQEEVLRQHGSDRTAALGMALDSIRTQEKTPEMPESKPFVATGVNLDGLGIIPEKLSGSSREKTRALGPNRAVVLLVERLETVGRIYAQDDAGQLWVSPNYPIGDSELEIDAGATVQLPEGRYQHAMSWQEEYVESILSEALQGPEEPQEGYGGVQGYADFLRAKNGPEEPQESRGR